jgi:aryl-alcohol dehydrogenase-like predicted oxidoreductase
MSRGLPTRGARPPAPGERGSSRLGLGLAALGRPGYINLGREEDLGDDRSADSMRRRAWDVLDAARDSGVAYFDVARSYGRAEEFLAGWLARRGIRPGEVVVGSKWGYRYTAGWKVSAPSHEVKDHSAAAFRSQLEETLGLLGDHLCLYQVHSLTPDSPLLDDEEALDELAGLASAGVGVGITVSGPEQASAVRDAMCVTRNGERLFSSVQATWNPLEQSAGAALREAKASGARVIVKEALANGRLTSRGPGSPLPGAESVLAVLAGLARRHKTTVERIALASALAQPFADVVLSGAASPAQLRSNLEAESLRIDPEELASLDGRGVDPAAYWTARQSLQWS